MPQPIYSLTISAVGEYVQAFLSEQKLILFSDSAPADIAMYCAVHRGSQLITALQPGQVMILNGETYPITAVGDVASANLEALGHITLNFDGAEVAELPGTLHIRGTSPTSIQPGDTLVFCRA